MSVSVTVPGRGAVLSTVEVVRLAVLQATQGRIVQVSRELRVAATKVVSLDRMKIAEDKRIQSKIVNEKNHQLSINFNNTLVESFTH